MPRGILRDTFVPQHLHENTKPHFAIAVTATDSLLGVASALRAPYIHFLQGSVTEEEIPQQLFKSVKT